ncbi:hypothetical protein QBC44DRAFT_37357 [Cladorrhinum sp. PSN332]|nr:hypothetical protein QBC44DRAFT_37357 [Cladorrhinum sp. PSN332]
MLWAGTRGGVWVDTGHLRERTHHLSTSIPVTSRQPVSLSHTHTHSHLRRNRGTQWSFSFCLSLTAFAWNKYVEQDGLASPARGWLGRSSILDSRSSSSTSTGRWVIELRGTGVQQYSQSRNLGWHLQPTLQRPQRQARHWPGHASERKLACVDPGRVCLRERMIGGDGGIGEEKKNVLALSLSTPCAFGKTPPKPHSVVNCLQGPHPLTARLTLTIL